MIMKTKNGGDDCFHNRLLSFLKKEIRFELIEFRLIRKNVFFVVTSQFPFILKGYSTLRRLKLQQAFTASLKKEGFQNTYSFYDMTNGKPLFFEKNYYGCLEYLEKGDRPFNYRSASSRIAGLNLLAEYHNVSKKLAKRYESLLPTYKLLEKWQERLLLFKKNLPVVSYYVDQQIIDHLIHCGEHVLTYLKKTKEEPQSDSETILHGDVAHHNFLQTGKKLHLIDFDLISIGPESADYLQYANRILPFINWSAGELFRHPILETYKNDQLFLYSLMFPTDIFREWNRVIREETYRDPKKLTVVKSMTTDQFLLRQQFMIEVNDMVQ
ncbi:MULTISPECIES: phosphotransferase [Bacillus]|uniref:phosphotransferase n=1 Tax=Bacillus TaxID=1386 RepID=UPI000C75F737|nr:MULTISPECIES: phosphotransferase [Bacillus]PLR83907.1 aminoglycoside phosphotransferase [Bacillus sp. V33-4]RSK47228.1 aminoglycoside phosphotransferase [Bacillus canaveralius]